MSIAALGTLLIGLATAAQTGGSNPATTPVAPAKQDIVGNDKKKGAAVATSDAKTAPSAALLEYLGQYEDAVDGLDPLGFDGENAPQDGKTATADKQGSGP